MRLPSVCWLIGSSLLVAACAGPGRKAVEAPSAAPQRPSASAEAVRPPSDAPWDQRVKLGRPYEVLGQRYTPRDERNFEEVGVASWYGPTFHGRLTANGEIFDEGDVSAAHRTLPLPSYVEVTNLDTGRSLVLRVNDRGPFASDRVIDLSRRAAQLLDSERAGLARVRVRRVTPTAEQVAALRPAWWDRGGWQGLALASAQAGGATVATGPAAPASSASGPASLAAVRSPAPGGTAAAAGVGSRAVGAPLAGALPAGGSGSPAISPEAGVSGFMVQVAAFSDRGRAAWLAGWAGEIAPARVERGADGLSRVRLGPFADEAAARAVLERVRAAGYPAAWLVRPAAVPLG